MIKVAITLIVIKLNIYENERRWKNFECSSNKEVKRKSRPITEQKNETKKKTAKALRQEIRRTNK